MARIPEEVIRQITSKNDIVSVLGEHLTLTKKGKDFLALCPFHADRHPSLSVSPARQIYKCFVCQNGGDVINFIRHFKQVSYIDAVKDLAERAGIDLTPYHLESGVVKTYNQVQERLVEICQIACDFFYFAMLSKKSEHNNSTHSKDNPYKYLVEIRHLTDAIIAKFQIGYADSAIISYLIDRGYSADEIVNASIATKREDGSLSSFFNDRIVFPFFDEANNCVGFSGRAFKEGQNPKYVNSRETEVFVKNRYLYNYHNAVRAVSERNELYIVEGFMDAIALDRMGLAKTVATMGTSFSDTHIKMIKRYNMTPVFSFDNDDAGQKTIISSVKKWLMHSKEMPLVNATLISIVEQSFKDFDDIVVWATKGKDSSAVNAHKETLNKLRLNVASKNVNIFTYLTTKLRFDEMRAKKTKHSNFDLAQENAKLKDNYFAMMVASEHFDLASEERLLELAKFISSFIPFDNEEARSNDISKRFNTFKSEFNAYKSNHKNEFITEPKGYNDNFFEYGNTNQVFDANAVMQAAAIKKEDTKKEQIIIALKSTINKHEEMLYKRCAEIIILLMDFKVIFEQFNKRQFAFGQDPIQDIYFHIIEYYIENKHADFMLIDQLKAMIDKNKNRSLHAIVDGIEILGKRYRSSEEYLSILKGIKQKDGIEILVCDDYESRIRDLSSEVSKAKSQLQIYSSPSEESKYEEVMKLFSNLSFKL